MKGYRYDLAILVLLISGAGPALAGDSVSVMQYGVDGRLVKSGFNVIELRNDSIEEVEIVWIELRIEPGSEMPE